MKSSYYAYKLPNGESGVVPSWPQAEKKVKGVKDARYRGFKAQKEAEDWLRMGAKYESIPKPNLERGIYFDAGTGRGFGVEISITDEKGKDLLHKVLPQKKINEFGKHRLPEGFTNNYGELLAMHYALRFAMRARMKKIFGDSRLALDYWSRGFAKTKGLPKETLNLIAKVKTLRKKFESTGGKIAHISGAHNPADLGFHN